MLHSNTLRISRCKGVSDRKQHQPRRWAGRRRRRRGGRGGGWHRRPRRPPRSGNRRCCRRRGLVRDERRLEKCDDGHASSLGGDGEERRGQGRQRGAARSARQRRPRVDDHEDGRFMKAQHHVLLRGRGSESVGRQMSRENNFCKEEDSNKSRVSKHESPSSSTFPLSSLAPLVTSPCSFTHGSLYAASVQAEPTHTLRPASDTRPPTPIRPHTPIHTSYATTTSQWGFTGWSRTE